nr:unnamed protein product [Digitaria exilis]
MLAPTLAPIALPCHSRTVLATYGLGRGGGPAGGEEGGGNEEGEEGPLRSLPRWNQRSAATTCYSTDILRLLTLWFNHGATSEVQIALQKAQEVVDKIRQHSGSLVDQAQLVSKELIRVAILWHEMWHEALEEASRMYFGEHNIEGMLAVLEPLHAMLERGAETIKENAFIQAYGHELLEAHECCLKYRATGEDAELTKLFGLVNTLLENSRKTSEKDLSIQRYAVIPLSPNSGLIGWVPNCDTLHALIREYRDARKIFLNQEHRLMLAFAPDYDHLPLIAKVEVFQHALQNTEGNDLAKVPFRLTRMLVKAMEVSGIEGTFRTTCENVMQVLRTNRQSVMAMMEAFVHDPLINWRLFNFNEVPQVSNYGNAHAHTVVSSEEAAANQELVQPQRGTRERELLQAVNQLGDANEVLNERAVAVMARMSHKLTGRDFSSGSASGAGSSTHHGSEHWASGDARDAEPGLSVKVQVVPILVSSYASRSS